MNKFRMRVPDFFEPYGRYFRKSTKGRVESFVSSEKLITDKRCQKILVISDLHGVFLDQVAFSCFLQVVKGTFHHKIIINGDAFDFPYLSSYASKIVEDHPALDDYSEVKEIQFVENNILRPLRAAAHPDTEIILREGNHCERLTKPKATGKVAEKIVRIHSYFEGTKLSDMVKCDEIGITYDPTAILTLGNDVFLVKHGASFAKNAQTTNIHKYLMSGTTGHSHRLGMKVIRAHKKQLIWFESGCLCYLDPDYVAQGSKMPPDWAHGFASVVLYEQEDGSSKVFGSTHLIDNGVTFYEGAKYEAVRG